MKSYIDVVKKVLSEGSRRQNRTGIETISKFHVVHEHDMDCGFPLLTTKKVSWKNILFENLWFLSGDSSNRFFERHNINFWKPWEFQGRLPKAYGEFWRRFPHYHRCEGRAYWDKLPDKLDVCDYKPFDQFEAIVNELKSNRNSRRICLTNWYPPHAWSNPLPPCHLFSIFNVQYCNSQPFLNLHTTIRSNDLGLGCPYNIAGYGFVLSLMGHLVKLPIKYYIQTSIDMHVYVNHIDGLTEQIGRQPRQLPTLCIDDRIKTMQDVDELIRDGTTSQVLDVFKLQNYNPHPNIKLEVAV
jgi:thymidylate synthase